MFFDPTTEYWIAKQRIAQFHHEAAQARLAAAAQRSNSEQIRPPKSRLQIANRLVRVVRRLAFYKPNPEYKLAD